MVFSTPTRTRLAGFCVTLSISFVGCAVTGSGDPFVYQAPAATESVIYHYRIDEGFRGSAIQWDVVSNEIPLTRIGKGGYFMETCAPSQRSYKTKKKADAGVLWVVDTAVFGWLDPEEYEDSIEISVEAGQSYFLRYDFVVGKAQPAVKLVSREVATADIEGLRAFPAAQILDEDQ